MTYPGVNKQKTESNSRFFRVLVPSRKRLWKSDFWELPVSINSNHTRTVWKDACENRFPPLCWFKSLTSYKKVVKSGVVLGGIYIITALNVCMSVYLPVCLSVAKLLRERWADWLQIWWKYVSNTGECCYLYFVTLAQRSRSP